MATRYIIFNATLGSWYLARDHEQEIRQWTKELGQAMSFYTEGGAEVFANILGREYPQHNIFWGPVIHAESSE